MADGSQALEEVKEYLRVTSTYEDDLLTLLIDAAVGYVEMTTNKTLASKSYTQYCDYFIDTIALDHSPLTSVTSINYIDTDGNSQLLSSSVYSENSASAPSEINLAYGQSWPATRDVKNAVTIVYSAGYATWTVVPELLRQAVKFLVGHWYMNREAASNIKIEDVPLTVNCIITKYKDTGYYI